MTARFFTRSSTRITVGLLTTHQLTPLVTPLVLIWDGTPDYFFISDFQFSTTDIGCAEPLL